MCLHNMLNMWNVNVRQFHDMVTLWLSDLNSRNQHQWVEALWLWETLVSDQSEKQRIINQVNLQAHINVGVN